MKRGPVIAAIGLVLVASWIAWRMARATPNEPAQDASRTVRQTSATHRTNNPGIRPEINHADAISSALDELRRDAAASSTTLSDLREALFQSDPEASARAVAAFLRTGEDAPTGQPFVVGPEGVLSGMPSLRAALLNWLPTLDPETALELAREILKTTASPDEFALALRNIAWNDLDGDLHGELAAAFHHMLDRAEWRTRPTAGYLEAFDIAVELGDTRTFLRLSGFAHTEDPSLVHAACMSMDRMVLREPDLLESAWRDEDGWMDRAPIQRASLMSRLDITRDDHRSVFLDYLASPRMTSDERDYFVALFPNGNHLYGHRLVTTQEKSPTIEQRAALDNEALREIDRMLQKADTAAVASLRAIRSRVASFAAGP